tara:strand:+ start:316885 stop:317985 length:1101 start_codon:yes stop_codon:yes gene_type:complete
MKILKTVKYLMILTILIGSVSALEINEKLTTRFLKVSASKKTVLINRGLEDGLVVGDHAKFFLTTGVIARGVVVKSSPTRSIWSIYRIIDVNSVFPDKVVNIKITTPVKVTEDPTKSVYVTESPIETTILRERISEGMPTGRVLTEGDQKELASFKEDNQFLMGNANTSGEDPRKDFEAWGLLHLNNLSSTIEYGERGSSNGQSATVDFSLGVEKYFYKPGSFLNKLSISGIVHSSTIKSDSVQGQQVTSTVLEYGLSASYHFLHSPFTYGRFIGFGTIGAGVGDASDTIDFLDPDSTQTSNTFSGSSNFLYLGGGVKYFTKRGFGFRGVLDYYKRSESYVIENEDATYTKVVSGPRLLMGIAYRW